LDIKRANVSLKIVSGTFQSDNYLVSYVRDADGKTCRYLFKAVFFKLSKTTANINCATCFLTSIQCQILIKISILVLNFNVCTEEETGWLTDWMAGCCLTD